MLPNFADADAATLRRCLSNVLALSTLPAMWAQASPLRIAESLADALYVMLNPDFVYVSLLGPDGRMLAEAAQTAPSETDAELAAALGPAVLEWTRRQDPHDLLLHKDPRRRAPLRVTCRGLGYNAEHGVIAAGFAADDLPSPLHHLLLDVGATQATAGFSTALLVSSLRESEERFRALNESLEARAVERAKQLATSAERLYESEHRFRLLVEAVTDYAIFMLDAEGNVASWNTGAQRIKGYAAEEIIGRHFSTFYTEADRQAGLPAQVLSTAARTGKCAVEGWRVRKDGSTFWGNVTVHAIRDPSGELLGFAKITRDMTEKRTAEDQLRQAQKMEAIGHLTGGVAHDFNNLLAVICGNLDILRSRLQSRDGDNLLRFVQSAAHGAGRAAILTQRLLAFGRRQPLAPTPLLVNNLITGLSEMLRRTLGETIAIETVLGAGLWHTFVDPNQLESALLNLAVNARDAMPGGGKLTIEAANIYFDEQYAGQVELPPGQYVGIFVSDTGTGMPPDIVAKAFEPFFTTKATGHGTGLGLSQVYGFMKQSGGQAKIYSEVGSGTTIKLYLPRYYTAGSEQQSSAPAASIPQAAGESILVAEDDPDVRNTTTEMVRQLSYRVFEAPDAASALRLLETHPEIQLLFTDVGLPGDMNGRQLAEEALRRRPTLKLLFTSGYARSAIVHHGRLDAGVELLVKPFTYAELAGRIRRALDGG